MALKSSVAKQRVVTMCAMNLAYKVRINNYKRHVALGDSRAKAIA